MTTAVLPSCPFSTCVTPGISRRIHPEGEPCIHIYINVFLALRHFFLFRLRVVFRALGSVARRDPAQTPCATFDPDRGPWLTEVRGTSSGGSKSHVPSGKHAGNVESHPGPWKPTYMLKECRTAHVQVRIMSVGSYVIMGS